MMQYRFRGLVTYLEWWHRKVQLCCWLQYKVNPPFVSVHHLTVTSVWFINKTVLLNTRREKLRAVLGESKCYILHSLVTVKWVTGTGLFWSNQCIRAHLLKAYLICNFCVNAHLSLVTVERSLISHREHLCKIDPVHVSLQLQNVMLICRVLQRKGTQCRVGPTIITPSNIHTFR